MLNEVVAGVLVEAIAAVGRRLGLTVSSVRSRRYAQDLAVVRWFDTYRLTDRTPAFPELDIEAANELAAALRTDAVQAVLHELRAARLTDAPEADVKSIRKAFGLTLSPAWSGDFTARLFEYYDQEVCALVGRLEGAEPSLLRQIRGEAMSVRMIAILHAIERHIDALEYRPDSGGRGRFSVPVPATRGRAARELGAPRLRASPSSGHRRLVRAARHLADCRH